MSEVTVRKLLPKRHARELPEWDVLLDGKVIGRISEQRIGRTSTRFFYGLVVHPDGDKTFPIEVSADFDERVAKVHAAHLDPDSFVRPDSWGKRHYWGPLDARMSGLSSARDRR